MLKADAPFPGTQQVIRCCRPLRSAAPDTLAREVHQPAYPAARVSLYIRRLIGACAGSGLCAGCNSHYLTENTNPADHVVVLACNTFIESQSCSAADRVSRLLRAIVTVASEVERRRRCNETPPVRH